MSMIGTASQPTPIYVLGDSNVCSLADHMYRARSGRSYLFRALYCPGLLARDFVDDSGRLGPRITAALEAEQLLVRHGDVLEPAHATTSPHWRWVRQLEHRDAAAPPVVVAAGVIDMHEVSVAISEPDIELPEALRASRLTPQACRHTAAGALSAQDAVRRYAAAIAPLRLGLRRLRALGFTRLAVMGLAPITTDDAVFDEASALAGFPVIPRPSPNVFRYKGLLICNGEIARICAAENVLFLDRWAEFIGEDGFVRPGELHDFVHFAPEASKRSAAAIAALFSEPEPHEGGGVPELAAPATDSDAAGADRGAVLRFTLVDPHLAAVQALAAVVPGDRVLDVCPDRTGLADALAADGAHVTTIVLRDAEALDGSESYDIAVACGADELAPGDADRLYRRLATALHPSGTLIVRPVRNALAGGGGSSLAPSRLRRQVSAAFPHVILWFGNPDDPGGSLARRFTPSEARAANDVFVVASHRPLDASELRARITTEPLDIADDDVLINQPYAPRRVVRGQRFLAELTLDNRTDAALSSFRPNPVRFAPIWLDENGIPVSGDRSRAPIAPAARPYEPARYAVEITPPEQPGRYTLRFSIVQEFVRWYSAFADVAVTVV